MHKIALGSAQQLTDLLKTKVVGEPVNVHVVDFEQEPQPDFEKMRKLIAGEEESPSAAPLSEPPRDRKE